MTSSRWGRLRFGRRHALCLCMIAGLCGLTACANQADDGTGEAASADAVESQLSADGSEVQLASGDAEVLKTLPVRTVPVEEASGLIRYTDRTLDVSKVVEPKTGRDSASRVRKIADARRAGPSSISASASVIDRAAGFMGDRL